MPLPKGTRYRWTHTDGKVRLAFARGTNRVIEAKSSSGKVHTPAEFAADRARSRPHGFATLRKRR